MSKEAKKSITNPNGANQWVADPRQQLFLAYYLDPTSPTFSNVSKSGLRAGFSEEYSSGLLARMPSWLAEKVGNISPLLLQAERNIEEFLKLPNETQAIGMYGPIHKKEKIQDGFYKNGKPKYKTVKVPQMELNPKVMKIKQDSTHFIAETIGKKKYTKKEGNDSPVYNVFIFENDQRNRIAQRIIGGGSIGNPESPGESN